MHLVLSIQKKHQIEKHNKGNTVLIFDEGPELDSLTERILDPPAASQGFYARTQVREPLDQIIDVPYSAKSHHIGLIQLADLFAFILRLYAAIMDGIEKERYTHEVEQLKEWIDLMRPVLLPDSSRWPQNSKDPCVKFLRAVAPPALLKVRR